MATPSIDLTGTLCGLVRKPDESGEIMSLTIKTKKVELWHRLLAHDGGEVSIEITPQQGELDMEGKKNGKGKGALPEGVKPGSEAATGAVRAQD